MENFTYSKTLGTWIRNKSWVFIKKWERSIKVKLIPFIDLTLESFKNMLESILLINTRFKIIIPVPFSTLLSQYYIYTDVEPRILIFFSITIFILFFEFCFNIILFIDLEFRINPLISWKILVFVRLQDHLRK